MIEHAENEQGSIAAPAAPVAPAACPDENALAELVQGLLDDVVAGEIELHLDGCAECRRTVSSVGQSSYLARRTRVDSGRAEGSGAPVLVPSTWSMDKPAAPEMRTPEPGTILAGKYRVEGLLGQGGMGVVMAATHLTLGKLVALKLMRPDLAVDKGAAQRFVREARAASLLRSEHIVRVIDLDTLEDGAPYIAMEYLEGEDLGALLARAGAIPAHEAATYIVQVCEAVAEAHASGIVHRDLKPANLFLTHRAGTPCVKVLDFGVSKIIAGGPLLDDVASTDTKSLVGSPHYMAPEQLISAKSVDPRTDVWALGIILFELVSGQSPFATGGALAQVLASILRDNAPSLRDLRPDLPPAFIAIVERCLQKDPAQRFQRVDDLAVALAAITAPQLHRDPSPFVSPRSPSPTALGIGTPTRLAAPTPATPAAETQPTRTAARRHGWLIAGIAIALLALGGYVGYRVTHDTKTDAALSTTPPPVTTMPPASPPPPAVRTQRETLPAAAPAPSISAPPPSTVAPSPSPSPSPKSDRARSPRAKKLEDDLIGPSFD